MREIQEILRLIKVTNGMMLGKVKWDVDLVVPYEIKDLEDDLDQLKNLCLKLEQKVSQMKEEES